MKKVVLLSVLCVTLALAGGGFLVYRVIDSGFLTGASAERSELIGTWSGPQGARVTLHEDGTAEAVKIPGGFDWSSEKPIGSITGDGTWTLKKKPNAFVDQEITLDLKTGKKVGALIDDLHVLDKGAQGGIYMPISEDSSNKFIFKKSS
ncbi:hypothetical protein AB0I10_31100 [Streptomyces sp. NPDC050636]|uniref:hypothetical protein n=1 Tax=Streptomyces sp. NPDC050636 TaxID=3154510 RepID=UPI00343776D4